jgi:hypothetical protein
LKRVAGRHIERQRRPMMILESNERVGSFGQGGHGSAEEKERQDEEGERFWFAGAHWGPYLV